MTDRVKKPLAFCLYKYFPHGGLQRDMLSIALECQSRGYPIEVYTTAWEGDVPGGFELHIRPAAGLTNHGKMRRYHAWVAEQLTGRDVACVVGFNKMPGLDVYFAADSCYQEKARQKASVLDHITGRYQLYSQFEAAVFAPTSRTEILLIAEPQRATFQKYYNTPSERMHLLTPWIAPERTVPEDKEATREQTRRDLGIAPEETLLLQVGSGFKTKGLDRSLRALAALPTTVRTKTKLAVAGRDKSKYFEALAHKLDLADRVLFLGPRDDVMALMAAADMLIHPARTEAAGVVLIEALISGLPVLCTATCGHAHHIQKAQAGIVLPDPFTQPDLNHHLAATLTDQTLSTYAQNAQAYAQTLAVHQMPTQAANIIESVIQTEPLHP